MKNSKSVDAVAEALKMLDSVKGICSFARVKIEDLLKLQSDDFNELSEEMILIQMLLDRIKDEIDYKIPIIEQSIKDKSEILINEKVQSI